MEKFKNIKTDRLLIRTLEMKDKEAFFEYRSMPEIYQYQSWRPKIISEVEELINENIAVSLNIPNTWLQVAVCLNEEQMIGDIGIHFMEDGYQVEIGYTLSPEYQGKGYALEAVTAVINYAFTDLKKHRITASVDPDNLKSIKLLERIGFRKEGHFIKSFLMNDQWYDDYIYALLEDEWKR
jgi:RimJ/RimL family protein N-acetyltransferase